MNIEYALTQEILAHPDDDLPRQAYADWLEEQGQLEHADLIRVQLQLARMAVEDERRPALLSRQLWLLARHAKEWGRPLRGLARRWEFRRGFIEGVTLPADRFVAWAVDLFGQAPLRHLHLAGPQNHPGLPVCSQLGQVRELTVTAKTNIRPRSHPILDSPHLRRLQALRLFSSVVENEDLHAIAGLSDLEVLELQHCGYYPPSWSTRVTLATPGSLPRLRHLSLSGWGGPVAWASVLDRLEVLELRNPRPGNVDVLQLLALSKRTRPLRVLLVANVSLAGNFTNLLASRAIADLHTLELRDCALDDAGVRALAGAGGPERLVHLDLSANTTGNRGLQDLMGSGRLSHLTHLGLARVVRVRVPGEVFDLVHQLDTAPLPRLAALDLSGNDLFGDDVQELAASTLPSRLYSLDLRNNRLGDKGAAALLAADWPRLAWLGVKDNGLSSSAQGALRRRFGYSVAY